MTITGTILCILFFAGGTAFNAIRSRQLWSGSADNHIAMVAFSLFTRSAEVKRGMVRGTLVRTFQTGCIGLFMICVLAAHGFTAAASSPFMVFIFIGLSCMVIAAIAFVLQLWIIWFNTPKFLVPPTMRSDVGTRQKSQVNPSRR